MILVTGGAGYVGSHVISQFNKLNQGDNLLVVDDLSEGHREALNDLAPDRFIKCDIGNLAALRSIFAEHDIDVVSHFAGSSYVGESQEKSLKYYQNNVVSSLTLFRCMQEYGVRKLVFSSSCATYGNPEYTPIDELHCQKPVNTYGVTKLIVEHVLENLAQSLEWSYVSLRYFNAAGADKDCLIGESHSMESHLLPRILKAAKGEIDHVEIYGNDYPTFDGTCIRDYVHVSDLADAHLAALKIVQSKKVALAVNLGTSAGVSVKELITKCQEITGKEISIKIGPRRPGDPPELVADFQRAKSFLSWEPKYTLSDIIETAWKWELNHRY